MLHKNVEWFAIFMCYLFYALVVIQD